MGTRLIAMVLAAMLLAGCGGAEDRKALHFERARAFVLSGELEKARVEYLNVLQVDHQDATAHVELARVLERLERWRGAYRRYARAVELAPDNVEAALGKGRLLLLGDEVERAATIADEVLRAHPDHPEALLLRAGTRAKLLDDDAAIEDVRRALGAAPETLDAYALLAHLLVRAGRLDEAVDDLRGGLARNPDSTRIRMLLAEALSLQGEHAQAEALATAAVTRGVPSVDAAMLLSRVRFRADDLTGAERALEQAMERLPGEQTRLLEALANLIVDAREPEEAVARIERLAAAHPRDTRLLLRLARFRERVGDAAGAESVYRDIAAREGTGPLGLEAKTQLARNLSERERLPEARALVAEVLAENPAQREALILRGTFALLSNDPNGAITDFRTVLSNHPNETNVLRLRARAHLLNNEPDQAKGDLQRVLTLDPDNLEARLELLGLFERYRGTTVAREREREQLLEATLAAADRRIARDPRDTGALRIRAQVALVREDSVSALADAERLLEAEPESGPALRIMARARAEQGDLVEASRITSELVAADPNEVQARVDLAKALRRSGDLDAAVDYLDEALAVAPDDADVLEQLAETHLARGDWDRSLEVADALKGAHPELASGHYISGLVFQSKGDLEQSAEAFRAALEHTPNAIEPLTALARVYLDQGRTSAATDLVQQALELNSSDVRAVNLLGEVALAEGRNADAESAFRKAMGLNPRWAVSHRNLALARLADGDTEGAIQAYRNALAGEAGSSTTALELAGLYERTGRVEEAVEQYRAALALDPASEVARNNLAMLLATHYEDEDRLRQAAELAAPLARSERPAFIDTAGWVQFRLGDLEAARELFARALRDRPENPEFNYHMGLVYSELGEGELAERHLVLALESEEPFATREEAQAAYSKLLGRGR